MSAPNVPTEAARINARRSLRAFAGVCALIAAMCAVSHEGAAAAGFVTSSLMAVITRSLLDPEGLATFLLWFEPRRKVKKP